MEVLLQFHGNLIFMGNSKQILVQNLFSLISTRKKNILYARNSLLFNATTVVDLFLEEGHSGYQKIQIPVKLIGHKFQQLIVQLGNSGQKKHMHNLLEPKNTSIFSSKNGKFLKLLLIDLIFKLYHCLWKWEGSI